MKTMPENAKNLVNEFINQVKEILGEHLKRVILYGSYARGDFQDNSDIDIMFLTDFEGEEIIKWRNKIVEVAYNIEFDNNFYIDFSPLVKNINDYNTRIEFVPFYMNVQKEGIEL